MGQHSAALEQLVALDAIDQELLALRAELAATPAALAKERAALDAQAKATAQLEETLAARSAAQRGHEGELEDVEAKEKKSKRRLEELFVPEQIDATRRAIHTLGERRDELEFVILELMDEVDSRRKELGQKQTELAAARAELAGHEDAWTAREPKLQARIAVLEGEREELVPAIPAEAMKAYRIGYENRNNRHHQGATRTEGIMCVLCRTEVPARWANAAIKGDGIHGCISCKRVIVGPAPTPPGDEDPEPISP